MNYTALIGSDTRNSLSPAIHSFLFKKSNIRGHYKTFSVGKRQLKSTVRDLVNKKYVGFNVTNPYKEDIIEFLDELDLDAQKIGAVNTVLIQDGKLIGYNTDYYGFIQGIKSQIPEFEFKDSIVLLLGAGGVAKAVLYALNKEDVQRIYLYNRTFSKAENLSNIFKNVVPIKQIHEENIFCKCDLIVSTLPLTKKFIELNNLKKNCVVNDVMYIPTNLLLQAGKHGIGGMGMLIWQAELAFKIWFKKKI